MGRFLHYLAVRPAPPVVEGGQTVALGESVELELPRLDSVAAASDQQNVWSFADLLGPDLQIIGGYVLTHPSGLLGLTVPALHVFGVRAQVCARLEERS
jgi:hypothetical protein